MAEHDVVIVGAGFAGIGMAIALKRACLTDLVVLEKADALGGTWRDNTYPGCGCDVPSHLYSYSFAPNPDWTSTYAGQAEILAYLRGVADREGVTDHIRYGAELVSAKFDESTDRWLVHTANGEVYSGRALVLGLGPLHRPAYPDLPGLNTFAGTTFHSARWNHGYDLRGKRIAVVGTGASAAQFVPRIVPEAAAVHVYQRTPPWVIPRPDKPIRPATRALLRRMPPLRWAYRACIYALQEATALGFTMSPRLLRAASALARRHLHRQVADPALRAALTPTYTMGCKRVVLASDYYPALTQPHVELVTDPIAEVRPQGIVTADGTLRGADAIILGTGFHVTDALTDVDIVGRDRRSLGDAWREGMRAHLGITVAGFPNMFLLVGPNTGLGHNSIIFMIEAQLAYIRRCIARLLRDDVPRVEVAARVQDRFNARVQARLGRSVWNSGGCRSWYLDPDGVNRTLWPGFTVEYWLRTRRPHPADFRELASESSQHFG